MYPFGEDGLSIKGLGPGRPGVVFNGDIHLALHGDRVNAHYNALRQIDIAAPTEANTARPLFFPEVIRPHTKASPRKSNKGRPRKKSTVLTDTPEKSKIEEEINVRSQKKQKSLPKTQNKTGMKASTSKQGTSKKNIKQLHNDICSDDNEEECFCLVCIEPYSNSLPGESWFQCYYCKGWAHDECTGILGNQIYMSKL